MRCLPSGNPSLRRSRAQMLLRDLLGFQGARGTEPEGWPLRLFRLPVTRRDRCDDPGEFILREGRVAPFACPEREDCANIRLTYADAEETPGQPCGCVVPHAFVGGPEQRRRNQSDSGVRVSSGSDVSLPPHPRARAGASIGRDRQPRCTRSRWGYDESAVSSDVNPRANPAPVRNGLAGMLQIQMNAPARCLDPPRPSRNLQPVLASAVPGVHVHHDDARQGAGDEALTVMTCSIGHWGEKRSMPSSSRSVPVATAIFSRSAAHPLREVGGHFSLDVVEYGQYSQH